ncbi:MAG: phosphate ABC transporter permease PstA [Pseudomonadota bacterium]
MSSAREFTPTSWDTPAMARRIRKRYAREQRFRAYGVGAIAIAIGFLILLMGSIALEGLSGFTQTKIKIDMRVTLDDLGVASQQDVTIDLLRNADYREFAHRALAQQLGNVTTEADETALRRLISRIGVEDRLFALLRENPDRIGEKLSVWVEAAQDVDLFIKGKGAPGQLSDQQVAWVQQLREAGHLERRFHNLLFANGHSADPETAGVWVAIKGSVFTLIVTFLFAFPVAVGSAIYLEEFAPQNRFTDLIEININNLAAVPSIVFGLLGLSVFQNLFGLPRSTALIAGLTLGLMTLPTIIIAARAALKAVPGSIRSAATGLGASPIQVVFHHVLPLALPGILTGAIIGMAQALGETAPLLMIGLNANVFQPPQGFVDPTTVLPVQIFNWWSESFRLFREKAAAGILVMLAFLFLMNAIAVYLRNRFEKKW